ncbi:hypothetical protein BX589_101252 [Paraburkholderia fungorum]|jgi:hypothetical protein|uniref:hypothetical protein n=1 Tax=Paraburkholderia fungorum TaxID=134537 RepID=UPI000D409898|nr:hypothetical protein [Paraburkholderia fungorum]PRZ56602.1 hypothetical protein BX589_101252 [Paraburkholderia fungorum]
MDLHELMNVVLRAFVIALLLCVFMPGQGRFHMRFSLGFVASLAGGIGFLLWGH